MKTGATDVEQMHKQKFKFHLSICGVFCKDEWGVAGFLCFCEILSKFPYVGVCEVVWMHFVSFGEKETYNFWMGVRQKNDGVCDVGDFIQNLFWV